MAVGGIGMISTANYIARKYGVRSAMPGFIGKALCPALVFVPCNFELYSEKSGLVKAILRDFDPDFESFSLDGKQKIQKMHGLLIPTALSPDHHVAPQRPAWTSQTTAPGQDRAARR